MIFARARSLLLAGASVAAIGGGACAGGPFEPPPVYDAQLQVGNAPASGDGFIAISDYADVDLVGGAQGGFHVWINVRVHGIEGPLQIEREARRVSDDALVLRAVPRPFDVPSDAMVGWWENPGAAPAFMCPSPIGISVIDEPIRITVRLRDDGDQIVAEDSVVVVPHCNTQAEFCQSICSG